MRVMILIKSDPATEAAAQGPSEELLTAMQGYNEQLVKAGVMLSGEGLHPSSKGARVVFEGGRTTVVDGPFAAAEELVAGFWIWKVESLDEAVEWVKRCPADPNQDATIEIRPVFEAEDFGSEYTPELRGAEERLRAEIAAQQG